MCDELEQLMTDLQRRHVEKLREDDGPKTERDLLDSRVEQIWDRLLNATDEFQLEKANSLLEFLKWRAKELKK